MVPAVALKVAEVPPAAILTEVGVVSKALLSDTATLTPPVGAGALKVTVQVLAAPLERLVGLHCSEETVTDTATVSVAVRVAPA
jgi:hypothetical protein